MGKGVSKSRSCDRVIYISIYLYLSYLYVAGHAHAYRGAPVAAVLVKIPCTSASAAESMASSCCGEEEEETTGGWGPLLLVVWVLVDMALFVEFISTSLLSFSSYV